MEDSAVNPFGAGNPFTGSLPQRSPFDNLSDIGRYIPEGVSNPFTSPSTLPGGINPFISDGGSRFEQLIFNRLRSVLGNDFFDGSNNPFTNGGIPQFNGGGNLLNLSTPPFNGNNAPVGNGNRDFGNNSATIGNFNSNYGNDSATIGNGNWNFNKNNTTIGNGNWKFGSNNTTVGNGNWHWDDGTNNATLGNGNWQFGQDNQTVGNGNWHFGSDNTTIGNGNWHWDEGTNNTTLGNGNWQFGSENKTLGNGNWDFGTNNTIVGNGNIVFTSGNTIVGDGNLLVRNSTVIGVSNDAESLNSLFQKTPSDVDSLINSLVGTLGQEFIELTGNFDSSETQIYNRLILSRGTGGDNSNISNQLDQFFSSLFGDIPFNELPYQPGRDFQSVPEPTASVPLIVSGFLLLLLSKFKQKVSAKNKNALSSSPKSLQFH
ncbi:hypothetical protein LC593_13030 [Nostoc sp. CHAB 5844]|nr:hypothetical protein [Nostoc sp. CHAB 5844]